VIERRPRADRGYSDFGWLKTYNTFSFGSYYAPDQKGYSVLRVLNEDRLAPGAAFGLHEHHDVEILTYVLAGTLLHEDTLGNKVAIGPHEIQRISAGTGIKHSEKNLSMLEECHFLQVWILSSVAGVTPDYAQKAFPRAERLGKLTVLASPDGRNGSLSVNQDCLVYLLALAPEQSATYEPEPGRSLFFHVVDGAVEVNGLTMIAGDAAKAPSETTFSVEAETVSEIMIFEMPG